MGMQGLPAPLADHAALTDENSTVVPHLRAQESCAFELLRNERRQIGRRMPRDGVCAVFSRRQVDPRFVLRLPRDDDVVGCDDAGGVSEHLSDARRQVWTDQDWPAADLSQRCDCCTKLTNRLALGVRRTPASRAQPCGGESDQNKNTQADRVVDADIERVARRHKEVGQRNGRQNGRSQSRSVAAIHGWNDDRGEEQNGDARCYPVVDRVGTGGGKHHGEHAAEITDESGGGLRHHRLQAWAGASVRDHINMPATHATRRVRQAVRGASPSSLECRWSCTTGC